MNIKKFIQKNIDIPTDIWKRAKGRVENIQNHIKGLEGVEGFGLQGSFSRKTVIRPKRKDEEFDVDITANFYGEMTNMEFYEFSRRIQKRLNERYTKEVSSFGGKPSKATSVTFSKEFHIDVVPLMINKGGEYVYDVIKNETYLSNPLQLSKGFNKMAKEHVSNSLRDVIKLIKYMRNLKAIDSKGVPSIMFDIFYTTKTPFSNNYKENILMLLDEFQKMESTVYNPFCNGEQISVKNIEEFKRLKQEIKILRDKLAQGDFTGLKKSFTAAGATFGISVAAMTSVAAKLGSGGVHVSSDDNSDGRRRNSLFKK